MKYLLIFIFVFNIFLVSADLDVGIPGGLGVGGARGIGGVDLIPEEETSQNVSTSTVNASEIWLTVEGELDDVSDLKLNFVGDPDENVLFTMNDKDILWDFTTGTFDVEGDSNFTGDMFITPDSGSPYLWTTCGGNCLSLQAQTPGQVSHLRLMSADGDGTDNVFMSIHGLGTPDDVANRERLILGYDNADDDFHIQTESAGTGSDKDLHLFTGSNTNQMILESDGDVGIGTVEPTHTLNVVGDGNMTGNLILGGALDIGYISGGTGPETYKSMIVHHDDTNGGGFFVQGPNKNPFMAFTGFDTGSARDLNFGGGGWVVNDSTQITFFVDSTYQGAENEGGIILKMMNSTTTIYGDSAFQRLAQHGRGGTLDIIRADPDFGNQLQDDIFTISTFRANIGNLLRVNWTGDWWINGSVEINENDLLVEGDVNVTGVLNALNIGWNRTVGNVTLKNTGDYVGIGTDTPVHKLDVVGDIRFADIRGNGVKTANLLIPHGLGSRDDVAVLQATSDDGVINRVTFGRALGYNSMKQYDFYMAPNDTSSSSSAVRGLSLIGSASQHAVIFNEDNEDIDLRVESDISNIPGLFSIFHRASDGFIGLGTNAPTHKLNVVGNVNITGNITTNQYYGEMWFHNDSTTGQPTYLTQGIWENVSLGFNQASETGGTNNGFTFDSSVNGSLIADVGGIYKLDYSISFQRLSGGTGREFKMTVAINGVGQENTEIHRKTGTGTDVGNGGGTGLISLSAGDRINLWIQNQDGDEDAGVHSASLNLVRVGN